MIEYIIFDFDGTVADTKAGIINAARYALNAFNIPATEDDLKRFVGPSLWYSFPTFYGFSDSDTARAVKLYREYYKPKGIYEAQLYAGMKEMLLELKQNGVHLGIASAKVEETVKDALEFMGVSDCFEVVIGSKPDGTDSEKDQLIKRVMCQLKCDNKNSVYIGDSRTDYYGAAMLNMDFIAAVYDRDESEFDGCNINKYAHSVNELECFLYNDKKAEKETSPFNVIKNAISSMKDLEIGDIKYPAKEVKDNSIKKYALALSGGGSRGAYEIGAWKALIDMGIEIVAVTGTSIGAINGALVAQENFEVAMNSWCEVTPEMVFDEQKGGLEKFKDTSKIKEMLLQKIDEDKIRNSKIRFGVISFNLTKMSGDVKFIEDIPEGQLVDYIMASANHPLFSRQIIDDNVYIDGGVYDNLPLKPLYEAGYRNLIAVDIRETLSMTYREFNTQDANIVVIKHKKQLGSVLSFTNELIMERITMGYYDAKRAFGKYLGQIYPVIADYEYRSCGITPEEWKCLSNDYIAGKLMRSKNYMLSILSYVDEFESLQDNVSLNSNTFYFGLSEILAEILGVKDDKEYLFKDFNDMLTKRVKDICSLSNEESILTDSIKEKIKNKDFSFDDESIKVIFAYIIQNKEKLEPLIGIMVQTSPRIAASYLLFIILSNR